MLYSGHFLTTDKRKWSVAFHALSWDDAQAVAADFNVTVNGTLLLIVDAKTGKRQQGLSHFAAWNFDGRRFLNEDRRT